MEDIEDITNDELDPNNILQENQVFSLYFNKINLKIIRDLNTRNNEIKYIEQIMTLEEIMEKFNYTFPKEKLYYDIKEKFLFLGENIIDSNDYLLKPIIMNSNGDIKDYFGTEYILANKKITKEKNGKKYKMFLFSNTFDKKSIQKGQELIIESDKAKNTTINPREIVESIFNEDEEEAKYMFERIRCSGDQINQISLNHFNCHTLKKLNTDKNIPITRQQFGFQSLENIKIAARKTIGDESKHLLLVGYTKYIIDGSRKPVYLKYNGWFSDTYADYWPNYKTIRITETLLSETYGKTWKDTHGYLLNLRAYEFNWGNETISSINYNDWFTRNYIQKYFFKFFIMPLLVTSIITGVPAIIALATNASTVGTAISSSTIGTAFSSSPAMVAYLTTLGISKGTYAATMGSVSNAKVGTGGKTKRKTYKKRNIKSRRKTHKRTRFQTRKNRKNTKTRTLTRKYRRKRRNTRKYI